MPTIKYADLNSLSRFKTKIEEEIPDVSGKEDKSNKVTSISSSSTDTQYPSAKCIYDLIGNINTILATLTTPSSNNNGGGN